MRATTVTVYDGLPSSMSRSLDCISAIELEAGDLPSGQEADLFFGATYEVKETLKAAGFWFCKVGRFACWAKPEVARKIKRIVEVADRHNLTARVII